MLKKIFLNLMAKQALTFLKFRLFFFFSFLEKFRNFELGLKGLARPKGWVKTHNRGNAWPL